MFIQCINLQSKLLVMSQQKMNDAFWDAPWAQPSKQNLKHVTISKTAVSFNSHVEIGRKTFIAFMASWQMQYFVTRRGGRQETRNIFNGGLSWQLFQSCKKMPQYLLSDSSLLQLNLQEKIKCVILSQPTFTCIFFTALCISTSGIWIRLSKFSLCYRYSPELSTLSTLLCNGGANKLLQLKQVLPLEYI